MHQACGALIPIQIDKLFAQFTELGVPACDDIDGDGTVDFEDPCVFVPEFGPTDFDGDGVGTACDFNDVIAPGKGLDFTFVTQCADGIDNDGDGKIDHSDSVASEEFGADPECSSTTDNDESS